MKIVGIPINMIAWVLLVVCAGFAWTYYVNVRSLRSDEPDVSAAINQAKTSSLAAAIVATVAAGFITLSTLFYTIRFKNMGAIGVTLFFLEFLFITCSTILLWLITNPEGGEQNYILTSSITSTVALILFSFYYMLEAYPYFKSLENKFNVKSPKSNAKKNKRKKE